MPSITREQAARWNAKARNGFTFDVRKYVVWGEKTLHQIIDLGDGDRMEIRLLYQEEYERKTNEHGCSWNVRTGRFLPHVHLTRWHPTATAWTSHGLGDWIPVGEPQTSKKYDVLCKLSATINAGKMVGELGKHPKYIPGLIA